ncbi:MAG TPA: ion channel [Methanobacterium sp.]|nr:ion channel [Methanobacterium sp.]
MERNFKLSFNGLLSFLILINSLIIIILGWYFALNLKLPMLSMIIVDLLVSFLIIIHITYKLSKERTKTHYICHNWIDILAIIPIAYITILIFPNAYLIIILLFLVRIYALFKYVIKLMDIEKLNREMKLNHALFVLLSTLIFGYMIFFLVESPVNHTIASTLDSSLFFIIISMTTAGYGNTVHITHIGQLIAVTTIIVEVSHTSRVTAAMASSRIEKTKRPKD